jgi:hypothetical protein
VAEREATVSQQHLQEGGERFLVELEALGDDHPPVRRLRHFLKNSLMQWRLKCRSIVQTTALPPACREIGLEDDSRDHQGGAGPISRFSFMPTSSGLTYVRCPQ